MILCMIMLLCMNFAVFGADRPRLGDLLPIGHERFLTNLSDSVKEGDLVLVKNSEDKWQYAKFCEKFGEGVCLQAAIVNAQGHGHLFFLKEVKSISDKTE